MAQKTNKSVAKRFRITRKGKVLHRPRPQNHFRAKQSSDVKRKSRTHQKLAETEAKAIRALLPFH
jgi:large subunit ribosomal protein L35